MSWCCLVLRSSEERGKHEQKSDSGPRQASRPTPLLPSILRVLDALRGLAFGHANEALRPRLPDR